MNYKTFCLFNQIPKEKLMRLTKRKMSKMNFSLLMSVFGAYRNAYYLSMNHPLYQYICHFTINRKLLSQSDNQKKNFEISSPYLSSRFFDIIITSLSFTFILLSDEFLIESSISSLVFH